MRLLLVEDDPLNVEFFSAVLEGEGHLVVVEMDGMRGRDRALADTFDMILLDIQLPGLTGDVICRELRAADIGQPILALSAQALPAQVERNLEAGFDGYLTKPITPTELRAAVRTYAASAADRESVRDAH